MNDYRAMKELAPGTVFSHRDPATSFRKFAHFEVLSQRPQLTVAREALIGGKALFFHGLSGVEERVLVVKDAQS